MRLPSISVPHLLFGGDFAGAQALETETSELDCMHSGSISEKNLRFTQLPLALGQRQRFGRQKLGAELL